MMFLHGFCLGTGVVVHWFYRETRGSDEIVVVWCCHRELVVSDEDLALLEEVFYVMCSLA